MADELQITADKNPFEELVRFLDRVGRPSPAEIAHISAPVRAGFAENFAGEHDGNGVPWPQLSAMTRRDRRKEGYPEAHPMLVRRGVLKASYTQLGHPDHVEELESDGSGWTLFIGTSNERARLQEFGGRTTIHGHEAIIPARSVSILPNRVELQIGDSIGAILDKIAYETLK